MPSVKAAADQSTAPKTMNAHPKAVSTTVYPARHTLYSSSTMVPGPGGKVSARVVIGGLGSCRTQCQTVCGPHRTSKATHSTQPTAAEPSLGTQSFARKLANRRKCGGRLTLTRSGMSANAVAARPLCEQVRPPTASSGLGAIVAVV